MQKVYLACDEDSGYMAIYANKTDAENALIQRLRDEDVEYTYEEDKKIDPNISKTFEEWCLNEIDGVYVREFEVL